jgi:hypothetical protein
MSPELRKAGSEIARIGKEIEDSQIEDGDPPFVIGHKNYKDLTAALALVVSALRHVAVQPVE